jgi:hypothetical protein
MSDSDLTLIRKNGGSVSAYDDAVIFHSALGHDYSGATRGIVFQGVHSQFGYSINLATKALSILSGMGALYGRQFELADGKTIDISLVNLSSIYFLVYVEINATTNPETISLKTVYGSGLPSLGNVDIYASSSGVATMPLYMFYWTGSALSLYADYRHIREPGTAEAALSIPGAGVINGNAVSDLVEEGTGYVKKARSADIGTTALSIGPSGNTNQIDADLRFINKNVRLLVTRRITATFSDEIAEGETRTANWTAPTGTLLGYLIEVTGTYYSTISNYSSVPSTNGYVGSEVLTFYCTLEDTNAQQPSTGIRYNSTSGCWLQITISSSGITVKALQKTHYINVYVTLIVGGA